MFRNYGAKLILAEPWSVSCISGSPATRQSSEPKWVRESPWGTETPDFNGGNQPGSTLHFLLSTEINSWADGHMPFMRSDVGTISRESSGRLRQHSGTFLTHTIPQIPHRHLGPDLGRQSTEWVLHTVGEEPPSPICHHSKDC